MRVRPDGWRDAATSRRNDSNFAFVATLLVAIAFMCASWNARADDELPGRVGRIADVAGQLYQSPEDRATEWVAVGLNYPVTSGDNLWVSGDGRAEVDYGGGQFRLAGDTNLHISRLDDNQIALFVAQGRVVLRVRSLDPGESARVDVPNSQIQFTRPGLYRIDVPDRQSTFVTVREGEAIVASPSGLQQTLPGQTVSISGPDAAVVEVRNGIGQDGFDAWSAGRDRYYERSRSTAYVSRQMVGSADLDQYGTWQTVPEYGPVWYPAAVAEDWAPYRFGYWTTLGGWGYTWVDYAPWGYAPFHYGRWVYVGRRWGWCPGVYVPRPIWAPALVGWIGGAGWGVSASVGSPVYGWVPLGWGEPYHPWWRGCSHNCWARYNRPYAVSVTVQPSAPPPRYRNIGVPGAVTAVHGATLAGRGPVASNLVRLPPQQLASAPVLPSAPPRASEAPHVPMVRAGTGGTPQPASTFHAPGRGGDGAALSQGARPPTRLAPTAPAESTSTRTPSVPRGAPPAAAAPATSEGGANVSRPPAPSFGRTGQQGVNAPGRVAQEGSEATGASTRTQHAPPRAPGQAPAAGMPTTTQPPPASAVPPARPATPRSAPGERGGPPPQPTPHTAPPAQTPHTAPPVSAPQNVAPAGVAPTQHGRGPSPAPAPTGGRSEGDKPAHGTPAPSRENTGGGQGRP